MQQILADLNFSVYFKQHSNPCRFSLPVSTFVSFAVVDTPFKLRARDGTPLIVRPFVDPSLHSPDTIYIFGVDEVFLASLLLP